MQFNLSEQRYNDIERGYKVHWIHDRLRTITPSHLSTWTKLPLWS